MYRFTNRLASGKFILVKKKIGEGSCALVVMKAPTRSYAAQKCQTKEVNRKRPFFWGSVGAVVLTGAAVVYARNSPEARNWLAVNVPMADDFISLIFQENTTYWKAISNTSGKVAGVVSDFVFGKEGVSYEKIESKATQNLSKDAAITFGKKDYQLPPPEFEPLYVEEKPVEKAEIASPATIIQTDKCEPGEPFVVHITKDLVELEQDMHENIKIAIDSYKVATKHCAEYNSSLYRIIEAPVDDLDPKIFSKLGTARTEKSNACMKATNAGAKAKTAMDTLERLLEAGVKAPPEVVASTRRYLKKFREDLAVVEKDYKACIDKSIVADKYWPKVEAARNMFKNELQLLFPGVDLTARSINVNGESDVDLLLIYCLKQLQFLQSQIAEIQTIREQKLSRAIECHSEKDLIEAKVEDILKRERIEKELEFEKRKLVIQAEANRSLKDQLKKQMEIHQDLLRDKLVKKEQEVMAKFSKQVSEQVEKERLKFKQDVAAMMGKMAAIENTLKQRAKAETEAKQSQSLWTAAEALLAATRRTIPETKVDKEIQAIEKAGANDKLVQTVMKGIPENARNCPIVTEQTLRVQYDTMEKTAMKVALVSKEGSPLPVYFLSWLQSKMLFSRISDIPQEELENKPTDFANLDTFEILLRARYFMEQGNLSTALRYVNLLQGASRAAARKWCENVRHHLEIRQAAEAVMAHASASALTLKN